MFPSSSVPSSRLSAALRLVRVFVFFSVVGGELSKLLAPGVVVLVFTTALRLLNCSVMRPLFLSVLELIILLEEELFIFFLFVLVVDDRLLDVVE